ncbi:MAG: segregation ATPase FtsK/SpoIIIE, family [Fimbriimonadaceae bacterium]|nr:segregation ATPase FtsK/SpoIIIE, family [Fimbriimonadaceae bacterium]
MLITAAVITVISLVLASDTGIIGTVVSGILRTLVGRGAWAVPFVLGGLGIAVIAGKRTVGVTRLTIGLCLIFTALIGAFAQPLGGDYFDPDAIARSGGYLGAIVGWMANGLLGAAKYVGLGALAMVGVILTVNTPIHALVAAFRERSRFREVKPAKTMREPRPMRAVVESPETKRPLPELDERRTKPLIRETQQAKSAPVRDATPKEGYQLPPMSLLAEPANKPKRSPQEMQRNIETLESTLEEFGIDANVVEVATGPTVTRYEIQLGPGIRVARITALADNIAMNLAASHVRVEAPIPGKAAIGVEVPNTQPTPVYLREVCDNKEFMDHPSRLAIGLGQDVSGVNKYADLTKMPHLLICGATNSGKSIGLATLITSLLMRNSPKDLRLVMIDPKRVELTLFDSIPHLMCPVIKDVKEAPGVLRAVWREMDRRYDVLSEKGVRNIDGWNAQASFQDKMPYIVVIIDELADLMIQAAAEVETSICRLAQLARAVGIHLVIATQRPSVDVITGTIKANIASRIAFTVSSQIDSRTILDQKGAESLIGRCDMLFLPIDASKPLRVQGCYVSEKEIDAVCKFWRAQESAAYVIDPREFVEGDGRGSKDGSRSSGDDQADPLWEEAVRWCADRGQASTSMLQRRFSIGFQRASRLLDMMEERSIVGPRDGPRPRDVLVSPMDVDALFGKAPVYDTGWVGDEEAEEPA